MSHDDLTASYMAGFERGKDEAEDRIADRLDDYVAALTAAKSRMHALEEANAELRKCLEMIRDFPKDGNPRRTKDGYPGEVIFDDFAYKRMVDSYREAAVEGLDRAARSTLSPQKEGEKP
jgi:hypothetical protein